MQVKKQQLELDMEQRTSSKFGKEYIKDVYCQTAYLTYRQSTSCEMLGWVKHKLGSRLPGEINTHTHTYKTMNFQIFKLDLEKAEEPEIKLPTSPGS